MNETSNLAWALRERSHLTRTQQHAIELQPRRSNHAIMCTRPPQESLGHEAKLTLRPGVDRWCASSYCLMNQSHPPRTGTLRDTSNPTRSTGDVVAYRVLDASFYAVVKHVDLPPDILSRLKCPAPYLQASARQNERGERRELHEGVCA